MGSLSDRIDAFADDGPEPQLDEVDSAEEPAAEVPGEAGVGAGDAVDEQPGEDGLPEDDGVGAGDGDDDQLEAGQEPGPAAEESTGPVEVKPEAKFLIDGQEVTGEEILKGRLAHADYTRKTQALADQRRSLEAKQEEHEDYREVVNDYFQRTYSDHNELLNEVRASAPKTYEALKKAILDEAIRVGEMTDAEFAMYRENDQGKHEAWKRARQEAQARAGEDRKNLRTQRAEIHRAVSNWRAEAMKAVGLSLDNEDHLDAFFEYMTARHRNERWTEDMIQAAAKSVAKRFGVKPPAPGKTTATPAKGVAKDPKTGQFVSKPAASPLPALKGTGARRPPGKGAPAPKTATTAASFQAVRERFAR